MKILAPFVLAATWFGCVASHEPSLRSRDLATTSDIWAGGNSYFLYALQDNVRHQVLDAMRDANLKVVRIFISDLAANNKGSGSVALKDVEVGTPGQWDDTILSRIDQLMVEVQQRGMKLIIALHDRWMLGHWGSDVYVSKYGLKGDDITGFYANTNAAADMDRRLAHILTHKNPHFNNRAWGDLDEAVLAFGIENESQGAVSKLNFKWVCDRATNLRKYVLKKNILVASGGGREIDTSLHPDLQNCAALDILGVHYYGVSDSTVRQQLLTAVNANKKRIYVEEFGASGNNKAADLRRQIQTVKGVGVPWIFWEVSKPGKGAADFEVWTDEPSWQAIKSEAQSPTQQVQAWPELGQNGAVTKPSPPPGKDDWQLCAASSECANKCCSKEFSNDDKLKCTPGGKQCLVSSAPSPSTGTGTNLDDWVPCSVSSQCSNGCCSKQFSNDGQLKCTPGGSSDQCVKGSLGDWQSCSVSAQCTNGCCSKQFSDDGQLKCTPGGSSDQCE